MTEDAVVAFRDPHGLRPLALGMIEDEGPAAPPTAWPASRARSI